MQQNYIIAFLLLGVVVIGSCSDQLPNPYDAMPQNDATADEDSNPPQPDSTTVNCDDVENGTRCGNEQICIDGDCVQSLCNDGFVDTGRGEECEDGNDIPFDGCDPGTCTFTCSATEQCADTNPCNGKETCDISSHTCVLGAPMALGDACTTLDISAGNCRLISSGGISELRCISTKCGDGETDEPDEECDDNNDENGDGCDNDCQYSCETQAECNDLVFCNGIEDCDAETHMCSSGEIPLCDDENPCTKDFCDTATDDCANPLIDKDDDGYAPTSLGDCGQDCNDEDENIHPGQEEQCDAIDHNCDGETGDNGSVTWYADCDGDGFAEASAEPYMACEKPDPSNCGGSWTTTAPTENKIDCFDSNEKVHPEQTEWFSEPIENRPDSVAFDYDCSGSNDQRYTESAGTCTYTPPEYTPCDPKNTLCWCNPLKLQASCFGSCSGFAGWTETTPECKKSGSYQTCDRVPELCSLSVIGRLTGCEFHCVDPKDTRCSLKCTPGVDTGCTLPCLNQAGCPWIFAKCVTESKSLEQTCR